jgi:hypothetical protein
MSCGDGIGQWVLGASEEAVNHCGAVGARGWGYKWEIVSAGMRVGWGAGTVATPRRHEAKGSPGFLQKE